MSSLTILISGVVLGWVAQWQFSGRRKGQENEQLRDQLAVTQAELQALQGRQEQGGGSASDRLEQIRGIGPVFARRLNEEGIFTFADLAKQSPERIREIVAEGGRLTNVDTQDWIAQAQQLAAGC